MHFAVTSKSVLNFKKEKKRKKECASAIEKRKRRKGT